MGFALLCTGERVRDLFAQTEDRAPCIIFIDELDALGKTRVASPVGTHEEREQTLNQLLAEMDGFDPRKGVIVMSATNRPEVLDPALLRPGRFDRRVVIDRPDVRGREAILRLHARAVKLAADVDLKVVASRTTGFAGADLATSSTKWPYCGSHHCTRCSRAKSCSCRRAASKAWWIAASKVAASFSVEASWLTTIGAPLGTLTSTST
jgi:hypothetical protein